MTTTTARVGRNDPCPCGSGRKHKACHLPIDEASASAQREADHRAAIEAEAEKGPPRGWEHYHPLTHKIPAIRRPDFLVSVRNLAATGEGARMGIHEPVDLGRDQASVDEALAYLRERGVTADFWGDPAPEVLAAVQELLDRVLGRGVCRVLGSGSRLRRYGHTEIVDEGDGTFTVYVAGRNTMNGVVIALSIAIGSDARALGVTHEGLSWMWCNARVARELVVNILGLPSPLSSRKDDLATALVRFMSDFVDLGDEQHRNRDDLMRAMAAIPWLVGLREARRDPHAVLEGMGLEGAGLDAVATQVESAAASPDWLLRLADAAPEDWDTPDGYHRWREAAEGIEEVAAWLEEPEPAAPPDAPASLEAPVLAAPTTAPMAAPAAPDTVPADEGIRRAVPDGAITIGDSPFAAVEDVVAALTERREAVDARLREVVDRRAAADRARRELEARLDELRRDDEKDAAEEQRISLEIGALADEEADGRRRAVLDALSAGSAALAAAAETWTVPGGDEVADQASLAAARRTVADYDSMEREGLLARLPAAVRDRLTAEAQDARASLRALVGTREPIRVPVAVAAKADPNLEMLIALPFEGRSDLAPGGLRTALAIAVAGVVAGTVEAVKEAPLKDLKHEAVRDGVSLVRLRFSAPPPVPAEECAQFLASSLSDLGRDDGSLREAAVSIEARVEPEFEPEGD